MKILHSGYGGLGDNLMFSTLPRMIHEQMGERVFLSSTNPVRNPEIKDVVWNFNPYIVGEMPSKPNVGFVNTGNPYRPASNDFIKSVEILNDLEPENSYPEIYVPRLNNHLDLADATVIDVTAITRINDYPADIADRMAKFSLEVLDNDHIVFLWYASKLVDQGPYMKYRDLQVFSLVDLVDIIRSAKNFIALHSGAIFLAAAITQNNPPPYLYCFIPRWLHAMFVKNGNQSLFPNTQYIQI